MRSSSARQRGVDEAGRDVEADGARPDLAHLPPAQRVLALQRMAGNRAVAQMLARNGGGSVTEVSENHLRFSYEEENEAEEEAIEQFTLHAEPEAETDYSGVPELFAEPEAEADYSGVPELFAEPEAETDYSGVSELFAEPEAETDYSGVPELFAEPEVLAAAAGSQAAAPAHRAAPVQGAAPVAAPAKRGLWGAIKSGAGKADRWVKDKLSGVYGIYGYLQSVFDWISTNLSALTDAVGSTAGAAIGGVSGGVSALIDLRALRSTINHALALRRIQKEAKAAGAPRSFLATLAYIKRQKYEKAIKRVISIVGAVLGLASIGTGFGAAIAGLSVAAALILYKVGRSIYKRWFRGAADTRRQDHAAALLRFARGGVVSDLAVRTLRELGVGPSSSTKQVMEKIASQ